MHKKRQGKLAGLLGAGKAKDDSDDEGSTESGSARSRRSSRFLSDASPTGNTFVLCGVAAAEKELIVIVFQTFGIVGNLDCTNCFEIVCMPLPGRAMPASRALQRVSAHS